jgi:hypothetical protein
VYCVERVRQDRIATTAATYLLIHPAAGFQVRSRLSYLHLEEIDISVL